MSQIELWCICEPLTALSSPSVVLSCLMFVISLGFSFVSSPVRAHGFPSLRLVLPISSCKNGVFLPHCHQVTSYSRALNLWVSILIARSIPDNVKCHLVGNADNMKRIKVSFGWLCDGLREVFCLVVFSSIPCRSSTRSSQTVQHQHLSNSTSHFVV